MCVTAHVHIPVPDYADAYNNLGIVLQKRGELDAAIDSYKQAIKIKPVSADCFIRAFPFYVGA